MKNKNCYQETMERLGYLKLSEASREVYEEMGFMCGLEVHQQLLTEKKLFCNCKAGVFQNKNYYDAEIIRHMRPTLSEMGGYDGTALMEFRTRKNITYHISNETTCTYDIDDTPPFKINKEALGIALEIALLLKTNIVGELHITRKQYLDGSIPAGFQRTAIVSIEGQIPLKNKTVRIIQLSIEEDSCREVSDIGHERVYVTDRLGMPLIETVTYPDMKTPAEAHEAAQYIRYLNRSTGKVRTGIGAARQDVNVSITGGTRIEIKGVSHIRHIPELVHNEAFRQKSLLAIKSDLLKKTAGADAFKAGLCKVDPKDLPYKTKAIKDAIAKGYSFAAANLPGFEGILSFFTQPGRMFAEEIADRLKVIACIEKPNMLHSEELLPEGEKFSFDHVKTLLNAKKGDAQILFFGPEEDMKTAFETIEERCKLAFLGVPNETRKSLSKGITMFERVLPGADRMYPDTDSAPISIKQELIDKVATALPPDVDSRIRQLKDYAIPEDTFNYLLRYNLVPLIEKVDAELQISPKFTATLLAHRLKNLEGHIKPDADFSYHHVFEMLEFVKEQGLSLDIARLMLNVCYAHPKMDFVSALETIGYSRRTKEEILAQVPFLKEKSRSIITSKRTAASLDWMMKELRRSAAGNISYTELAEVLQEGGNR